jgi:uncharacterized cupredoxin-like copper-binding protein
LAASAAVLLTACGKTDAPLPSSPPLVGVTMREYGFDHRPSLPRGRVVLRVRNAGRLRHEMTLERLPEDFPPIDEQLRSKTRRAVATLAYLHPLGPGASDAIAVDLGPGRYAMVCFIEGRDGTAHALKGMNSEFRVR